MADLIFGSFKRRIAYENKRKEQVQNRNQYLNKRNYRGSAADTVRAMLDSREAFLTKRGETLEDGNGASLYLQKTTVRPNFIGIRHQSTDTLEAYMAITSKKMNDFFSRRVKTLSLTYEHSNTLQSNQAIFDALKNINKLGAAAVLDLETLGANVDEMGRTIGQRITDFNMDIITGGNLNGSAKPTLSRRYSSIIGLSKKEYNEYMGLISRFEREGFRGVSEGEKVTLERLALTGGKNTVVDWDNATANGVINYSNFSEKSDILFNADEMKKGVSVLREIGEMQERTAGPDGLKGWEIEFAEGLKETRDRNLTLVAHNGLGFDYRQTRMLLGAEYVSDAMKELIRDEFGNDLNFEHVFDPLHLLRNVDDRQGFYLNAFDGDVDKLNQLNIWMKENNKNSFTQEALGHAHYLKTGLKVQDIAHTSAADVQGLTDLLFSGMFDPKNAEAVPKTYAKSGGARKIKANGTQLFYAMNSSYKVDTENLMVLSQDSMTGEWRTSEGIRFGQGRVEQENFGQTGLHRRVLYSITGKGGIETDSDYYKAFIKSRPDLNQGELTFLKLTPYSNSNSYAAQNDVVLVGTKEQLMGYFNKNMLHVGNLENGKIVTNPSDMIDAELLKTIRVDEKGNVTTEEVTNEFLVNSSTTAFENDTATRMIREHSYRKDVAAMNYLEDEENYVNAFEENFRKEYVGNELKRREEEIKNEIRQNTLPKAEAAYSEEAEKAYIEEIKQHDSFLTDKGKSNFIAKHYKENINRKALNTSATVAFAEAKKAYEEEVEKRSDKNFYRHKFTKYYADNKLLELHRAGTLDITDEVANKKAYSDALKEANEVWKANAEKNLAQKVNKQTFIEQYVKNETDKIIQDPQRANENIRSAMTDANLEFSHERKKYEQEFIETVNEKTAQIAKDISNNKTVGKIDFSGTWYGYIGWNNPATGERTVLAESIDKTRAALNYYRRNASIIRLAANKAREKGGDDSLLRQAYYDLIMNAIEDANMRLENETKNLAEELPSKYSLGFVDSAVMSTERTKYYEIDMRKLNGVELKHPDNPILKVNLTGSSATLVDNIASRLNISSATSDNDKIRVAQRMINDYLGNDVLGFKAENVSKEVAGQEIVKQLKLNRQANPNAGYIVKTEMQMADRSVPLMSTEYAEEVINKAAETKITVMPGKQFENLGDGVNAVWKISKEQKAINHNIASEIVNNVMFDQRFAGMSEEEMAEAISKFGGHSLEDSRTLAHTQTIKKREALSLMEDLVSAITSNGGILAVQENKLFLFENDSAYRTNRKATQIVLPEERFELGAFHIEAGLNRTKYADPIRIGALGKDGNKRVAVYSTFAKAHEKLSPGYMSAVLRNAKEQNTLAAGVGTILSDINKEFRNQSTILKGDEKELSKSSAAYFGDLFNDYAMLGQTQAVQRLKNSTKRNEQILYDFLTGRTTQKPDEFKNLEYGYSTSVLENLEVLQEAISEIIVDEKGFYDDTLKKHVVDIMAHGNKANGAFSITDSYKLFGQNFGPNKRSIYGALSKAIPYDLRNAQEQLEGLSVDFGSPLREEVEKRLATGGGISEELLGREIETSVISNRAVIDSKDVKKILNWAIEDNLIDEDSYAAHMMSLTSTNEGDTRISSYIADAAMTSRSSTQIIDADKMSAEDIANINNDFRKNMVEPLFDIDKDGNFSVKYSRGRFVERGDVLFREDNYVGTRSILAKYDGFMKGAFFYDNKVVSEERLGEILEENKDKLSGSKNWRQEAIEIFEKMGFKRKFYVEDAYAPGVTKIADIAEKSASSLLMAGLGDVNQNVKGVLGSLGLDNMSGRIISKEIVQEMMTRSHQPKTRFIELLQHEYMRKYSEELTQKRIQQAIRENGYQNVQEFYNDIYRERHSVTDTVEKIFRHYGFLGDNQNIGLISNNVAGTIKHKEPTYLHSSALALLYNGALSTDANGNVIKNQEAFEEFKNLISKDGETPNLREIYELLERHGLYQTGDNVNFEGSQNRKSIMTHTVTRNGDTITATVEPTIITEMPVDDLTWAGENYKKFGKALRISERERLNTEVYKITAGQITKFQKILESSLGEHGGELARKYFDKSTIGQYTDPSFRESYRQHTFFTEGEDRIYSNYGDLSDAKQLEEFKKLEKIGISRDEAQKVMKQFISHGANEIGTEKIELGYTAAKFAEAQNFNTGKSGITLEQMTERANSPWKLFNVREVEAGIKSGGADKGLFEKNVVLDLDVGNALDGQQLYTSEADRYVALPYVSSNRAAKEDQIRDSFQKKVEHMQNKINYFENNKTSMTEEQKNTKIAELRETVKDIKNDISKKITSKTGYLKELSTAKYGTTARGLAQGMDFTGNEVGALKDISFLGINLSEEGAKRAAGQDNVDVGFIMLSEEARDNWFKNDYYENVVGKDLAGVLKEKQHEVLATEGTITTDIRYPANYEKSIGSVPTYFQKGIKGNNITVHERMFKAKAGDFDSDYGNLAVEWAGVEVDIGGKKIKTKIDRSTRIALEQLSGTDAVGGQEIKVSYMKGYENFFENKERNALHSAMAVNSAYRVEAPITGDSLSYAHLIKNTYDGEHLVDTSRQYSLDEIEKYGELYDNLVDNFEKTYVEKTGESIEDLKSLEDGSYLREMKQYVTETAGDEKEYDNLIEAMKFNKAREIVMVNRDASNSKAAAGLLDTTLFKMHRTAELSGAFSPEEFYMLHHVKGIINESALSGKNTTGQVDLEKVDKIQDSFNKLFYAARTQVGIDEASQEFGDVWGGILREAGNDKQLLSSMAEEYGEVDEEKIEKMIALMKDYGKRITTNNVDNSVFKLGISMAGLSADNKMYFMNTKTEQDEIMNKASFVNNTAMDLGATQAPIHASAAPTLSPEVKAYREAKSASETLRKGTVAHNFEEEIVDDKAISEAARVVKNRELLEKAAKKGSFSKGKYAALAVAGGLMLSGFVSGGVQQHATPAPAQTQADGAASEEADQIQLQQTPTLSDSNLNVMRGGPNSGYVININAHTKNGEQAAVNAITNAMTMAAPQNNTINLSMNTTIMDKMSQLQVNRMVAYSLLS